MIKWMQQILMTGLDLMPLSMEKLRLSGAKDGKPRMTILLKIFPWKDGLFGVAITNSPIWDGIFLIVSFKNAILCSQQDENLGELFELIYWQACCGDFQNFFTK